MLDGLLDGLLGDPETAARLSPAAALAAMLRVEAELARAQAEVGALSAAAAEAAARACESAAVAPADLAPHAARDGPPVAGLVALLRRGLAPEAAAALHLGATSQDIIDTALTLRLREILALWDGRLDGLLGALAALAEAGAATPMLARSYGQAAAPTSWGAVAAGWGRPLLRHRDRLRALGAELPVSLGGAVGTLAAMPRGPEARAALARRLGLRDPGAPWHAERDGITALAAALAGLLGGLGRIGEDLLLLAHDGVEELRLRGAGGSSAMPGKENPIAAAALVALARHGIGLAGTLQGAALHREARDGAAWFLEWLALPPLCLAAGAALLRAAEAVAAIEPDEGRMRRNLERSAAMAEQLGRALAEAMPRPEAEALAGAIARAARRRGRSLAAAAAARLPGRDWTALLDPAAALGTAPADARAFARAVREGAA